MYGMVLGPAKAWTVATNPDADFDGDLSAYQMSRVELSERISAEARFSAEYMDELILAVQGICLMAEPETCRRGIAVKRTVNTEAALQQYRNKWVQKNIESELHNIDWICSVNVRKTGNKCTPLANSIARGVFKCYYFEGACPKSFT